MITVFVRVSNLSAAILVRKKEKNNIPGPRVTRTVFFFYRTPNEMRSANDEMSTAVSGSRPTSFQILQTRSLSASPLFHKRKNRKRKKKKDSRVDLWLPFIPARTLRE